MAQIVSISVRVRTVDGVYGSRMAFSNGFNVVRGDNTSGKSSLFQALLYGLGAEELLGGKGSKTMQSALRDQVEDVDESTSLVIESYIDLFIKNVKTIRIRRFVLSESKSDKLIQINDIGADGEVVGESLSTWIHDKGGASNAKHGFHAYFANFLGLELPNVFYTNAEYKILYLQSIFPSFIIEQKKGWADFLHTIPYFKIKDVKSRVVEFILDLDVYINEKLKIELANNLRNLESRWKDIYTDIHQLAASNSLRLTGIPSAPEHLLNETFHTLKTFEGGEFVELMNFLSEASKSLEHLRENKIETTAKNLKSVENEVLQNQARIDELNIQYELESRKLTLLYSNEENYKNQLSEILKEIADNKDVQKLRDLGDENPISITQNTCPTCHQAIKDSLLPEDIPYTPMTIDNNIKFLKDQQQLINSYLAKHRNDHKLINENVSLIYQEINTLRNRVRLLKRELVSDERIPSISQIEEIIRLEGKLESLYKVDEQIDEKVETLRAISLKWSEIKISQKVLPKDFLSKNDKEKIIELQSQFRRLLKKFGYKSKSIENISISKINCLPVVQEGDNFYDIRYDSSASDLIRAIWAYTCSLYLTSKKFNGNHPGLLMFDEPGQQSMSNADFNSFFKELENYTDAQVLLFASFNNSDSDYEEAIQGVTKFNLNRIKPKLLLKE